MHPCDSLRTHRIISQLTFGPLPFCCFKDCDMLCYYNSIFQHLSIDARQTSWNSISKYRLTNGIPIVYRKRINFITIHFFFACPAPFCLASQQTNQNLYMYICIYSNTSGGLSMTHGIGYFATYIYIVHIYI